MRTIFSYALGACVVGVLGCGEVAPIEADAKPDDPVADGREAGTPDGGSSADALEAVDITEDVRHVPSVGEYATVAELSLDDATLNTDTLAIVGATVPDSAVLDVQAQEGSGGPELAVLHVRSLEVRAGGVLRVVGSRPLVIIASHRIDIKGLIDVAGRGTVPGSGGGAPAMGNQPGKDGVNSIDRVASGGGGGGHSAAGGRGGSSEICTASCTAAAGGPAGTVYGEQTLGTLRAGSGGGAGARRNDSCTLVTDGGAGGGAIQLYSGLSISIAAGGGINAGGGGGAVGACNQYSAGAGGGSGGAIYLQSPVVVLDGVIAANGGSGGGANLGGTPSAGSDGLLSDQPAPGGLGGTGQPGGAGATGIQAAKAGGDDKIGAQGGGGGGGPGRVAVLTSTGAVMGSGTSSPSAYIALY